MRRGEPDGRLAMGRCLWFGVIVVVTQGKANNVKMPFFDAKATTVMGSSHLLLLESQIDQVDM